jgi:hypothetical protein
MRSDSHSRSHSHSHSRSHSHSHSLSHSLSLSLVLAACSSTPSPPTDTGLQAHDAASSIDAAPFDGGSIDAAATDDAAPSADAGASITLPPLNGMLDYQLGGAYPPPSGVTIVSRDRNDAPAPGIYDVCYVNGFQIQPGDDAMWTSAHPDVILRDAAGQPVIDTQWNETLLDVSSAAKRDEIIAVVGPWIDGCRAAGFDAVEIDNLDSYSRSMGLLTPDDAVAMMALFAARAHADGLAIAQKNATELVPRRSEMHTDFVVAEECNHYTECDAYRAGYGEHVLMIEYDRASFSVGCAAYPQDSIVLRDRNLVPVGMPGYVYDGC